jgi:hypothetical protein
MPGRHTLLCALALTLGCGETVDEDSGWWLREAPDITGQYQFFVDGVSASNVCEDEIPYATDWLLGALGISGDQPSALTFTFSSGMSFSGSVDSTWAWNFGGSETYSGADLTVVASGFISASDGQQRISGSLEVETDDDEFTTNNCVFEVLISGTQISR